MAQANRHENREPAEVHRTGSPPRHPPVGQKGRPFSRPKRAHLLQLGEGERVAVLGSELHEPHVGRVRELGNDAEAGKQPE